MATLSRRSLVTAAASLPALAVSTAIAAIPEPDPIFAAIERHRELDDVQFEIWCRMQCPPDEEKKSIRGEHERASDAAHRAAAVLGTMRPMTAAGAGALFAHASLALNLHGGYDWVPLALANSASAARETSHADAELFELGEKILRAAEVSKSRCAAFNQAEEALLGWKRKNPRPTDLRMLKAWEAIKAKVRLGCRFDEAEAEWSAATDAQRELQMRIASYSASTIDGIQIKRRIVAAYEDDKIIALDVENEIADSIDRDIARLSRKEADRRNEV